MYGAHVVAFFIDRKASSQLISHILIQLDFLKFVRGIAELLM